MFQIVNNYKYLFNPNSSIPVQINIGEYGIYFDANNRNMTETMFKSIVNINIKGVDLKK